MAKLKIQLLSPDKKYARSQDSSIDSQTPYHKFFQLNKIAIALGIKKDKLYNNFNGKYHSLELNGDRQRVAKFMMPHIKKFCEALGLKVEFTKSDKAN